MTHCPVHQIPMVDMPSFTSVNKVCSECNAEELARERRARRGEICLDPGEKIVPKGNMDHLRNFMGTDTAEVERLREVYNAAYPMFHQMVSGRFPSGGAPNQSAPPQSGRAKGMSPALGQPYSSMNTAHRHVVKLPTQGGVRSDTLTVEVGDIIEIGKHRVAAQERGPVEIILSWMLSRPGSIAVRLIWKKTGTAQSYTIQP